MGVFQDETFSDALKLALAAGILSCMTPYTFPGRMPIIFLAPITHYDFTNPTTTSPSTTLSSTKILQPSYVAIPLYAIVPFPIFQVQTPPSQPMPSPHHLDSAFWDVVNRTVEYSVHGAVALAWFFSKFAEAVSQKDLVSLRDDRQPPSCDLFDLDPLPFIPTEDDLLRLDVSGLESIPLSELYLEEEDPVTTAPAAPIPLPGKTQRLPPPRSSSSDTTLATLLDGYLPGEDLSVLLQTPDNELYFNPKSLGATTPPWPFNSSAIAASHYL